MKLRYCTRASFDPSAWPNTELGVKLVSYRLNQGEVVVAADPRPVARRLRRAPPSINAPPK